MRSRILCVLLGLAMGWTIVGTTACVSYAPRVEKPTKRQPRTVDTPGRWIGLLKDGSTCPTVPGWGAQTLLELATAHARDGLRNDEYGPSPALALANLKGQERITALFHKHGLDRFCVYTSQGQGLPFRKPGRLSKAEPDKLGVTPSAPTDLDSLGEQIWPSLADRFLHQVGSVQLPPRQNPTVRLVIVDTQRTGEGLPAKSPAPVSWHGYGMAHLADAIVCHHDTSCPVHIATRLALRYEGYDSDPNSPDDSGSDAGGHQGRVGDLAVAILAELDLWSHLDPKPKLILNLSVGWDGEYQNLDSATMAVYDALAAARDAGALVITAAGNRSGGEDSHWPLLPAAWELHPPSSIGGKVAYAVGGVDWQGLPLSNARPSGMPQRVAYADHAVVDTSNDPSNGDPTRVYTGSSVSAVVASSIAAVAWHLQLSSTPADVMAKLTGTAETLPDTAATFYDASLSQPPNLTRLSLCQTVFDICGPNLGQCPNVTTTCQLQDHLPADLSWIQPHISSLATFSSVNPNSNPNCDPKTDTYVGFGASVTNGCPMETLPDMGSPSLVQTQPPETPCPTCSIVPDHVLPPPPDGSTGDSLGDGQNEPKTYSLAAAIDPDWLALASQNTIESAVLVIECSPGSPSKERLDLTPEFSTLLSAPSSTVKRIRFGTVGTRATLDGCTASMDFSLLVTDGNGTSHRSVQSPVYLDP
ncbi:MAG TPA: S8 family serine peptidase [Thermoanaerobaculia bacterium]|nr:S8 family serine peptidase [Thermoanaerobaculia bacterium]